MAGDEPQQQNELSIVSQDDRVRQLPTQESKGISVFTNLRSLEIIRCHTLKSLFPVSMSNHLQQLDFLKLYDCSEMEQVLDPTAAPQSEQNLVVKFPKLKTLILKHLPRLQSFCGENCGFEGPELELVRVKKIPEMDRFSRDPETPKLKAVNVSYVQKCWRGGLNETIQYLYRDEMYKAEGKLLLKTENDVEHDK